MADNKFGASGMNPEESRAALSLAGIFALRMLGLFLILPVFALYAEHLEGVTPMLVGLAIGAYGLTQALLQIPFGMLSDRIGRKPVIVGGLLLFALGSVVAASSSTIGGIIFGRALQGSGAIAAAIMALAADLSREEIRTRMMAVIGISIGIAFTVSMILGPILNHWFGVPGIFWLTALLALAGVGITLFLVPNPVSSRRHRDAEAIPGQFGKVLADRGLLRLNFGILTLHMSLTALFLAVPLALRDLIGLPSGKHWLLYLPVMVLSMGLMVPFIVVAERRHRIKSVLLGAIFMLGFSQLGLFFFHSSLAGMACMLLIFFAAFNILEATLPSLVSKIAPPDSKGTAMGVYSSSQFSGAFLGGLLGGWAHGQFGLEGVFIFGMTAALAWMLIASGMASPSYLTSHLLRVGPLDAARAAELESELRRVPGVGEVVVAADEGVAYLKIDKNVVDPAALSAFCDDRG